MKIKRKFDSALCAAYKDKLKSSGLSEPDARKLGFLQIPNPQSMEDHFSSTPAFKIPYTSIEGKFTGFYRIRYLGGTKKGFAKATSTKDRRYDQPAFELPQLYIPQLLPKGKTWKQLLDDPSLPIFFTEGELKSACATKHGIPTIALGGVWNFKSKKQGLFRLPLFDTIALRGRTVYIIFDSDAATNPQVLFAQYKFAEELFHAGAIPIVIDLPKVEGKKHGIDDFIVEYGIEEFKKLVKNPDNQKEFQFVKELMQLNSQIAIVTQPSSVVHFESGQLWSRNDAAMQYQNIRMMDKKISPPKDDKSKETIKHVEVCAFDKWLAWEQRNAVWAPVYEPGKDQFVWTGERKHYNTWKGWGAQPVKGEVTLWEWLLDNLFKNAEPTHRKWFEQWCAYPLQNPGTKLFTCPILFGQLKGTGKSLLGLSLMSIYGQNGAEITDAQLEDERNVFAAEKQFVLANEVTGSDKRTMVGRLRNLITQHTVVINKKYQPDYVVRDTINYFFTSNHVDAVYMEDDERRFFVHEVLGPRLVDVDRRKVEAYDQWLKSGECAKALFHYLLSVDLDGFDPTAPAPDTRSKAAMVEASRSEVENWCHKLKEDPDTCLRVGESIIPFSMFTCKQLIDIYAAGDSKKPYDKTMSNALRKAGFEKAGSGNSCPTRDGKINLWVVRRPELVKLSKQHAGVEYDKERELPQKKFAKGVKK